MSKVRVVPNNPDKLLRLRLSNILKDAGFYAPFNLTGKNPSAEGRLGRIVVFLEAKDESLHISGKNSDSELIVSLRSSDSQIASDILNDFLPILRQNLAINHNHKNKSSTTKPKSAKSGVFKGSRRDNIYI